MTMEKCPICKGRIEADNHCRRCGADLTILLIINKRHFVYCKLAIEAILANKIDQALIFVKQAQQLYQSNLSYFLLSLCAKINCMVPAS